MADHTTEALDALSSALFAHDRVSCVMAPGTGAHKVHTDLIAKAIDTGAPRVAAFAESDERLAVTAQNLRDALGSDVQLIVAGKRPIESPVIDAAFDTPDDLHKALEHSPGDAPVVVLSRFDNAPIVSEAQHRDTQTFSLLAVDQAHHTAGKARDTPEAMVLNDADIAAQKRVFFTPTPRVQDAANVRADRPSMDNVAVYGPRAVDLSIARARDKGLVADYDIWIAVVSEDDIATKGDLSSMSEETRGVIVGGIAMRKAMAETGHTRAVAYTNTIEASNSLRGFLAESLPETPVASVDHTMLGDERRTALETLDGDAGILTNVNILRDGSPHPRLQMAAILGSSDSPVRILQALSQVIHKDHNAPNKRGSVVVPLVVDEMNEAGVERALESSRFKNVINTVNAARLADATLDANLARQVGAQEGDAKLSNFRIAGLSDVSDTLRTRLSDRLQARTLDQVTAPFDRQIANLETFLNTHGRLPTNDDDRVLSAFMRKQQTDHKDGRIAQEHAERLNALEGWAWAPERASGRRLAAHLITYRKIHAEPPIVDPENLNTGAGDLALHLKDAHAAMLPGGAIDAPYRAKTDRRAHEVAAILKAEADNQGSSALLADQSRTEMPELNGFIEPATDPDAPASFAFRPLARRIPHFDTGIERVADNSGFLFHLTDLTSQQSEALGAWVSGLNGRRARAKIALKPVRDANGRYKSDEAGLVALPAQARSALEEKRKVVGQMENQGIEGRFTHRENPRSPSGSEVVFTPLSKNNSIDPLKIDTLPEADQIVAHMMASGRPHAMRANISIDQKGAPSLESLDKSRVARKMETVYDASVLHNRLQDAWMTGVELEAHARAAPDEPVPSLDARAIAVTGRQIQAGLQTIRARHANGKLLTRGIEAFDACPNHSWVSPEHPQGHLGFALVRIAQRHGPEIIGQPDARNRADAVGATLRVVDKVITDPKRARDLAEDTALLKKAGLYQPLAASAQARRAAERAKPRHTQDKNQTMPSSRDHIR